MQVQQEYAIASGKLAIGSRQFSYMSMTRPRTPRVYAEARVELATDGTSRQAV
jgi:hypothetical protein